jgi:hypothetical protein
MSITRKQAQAELTFRALPKATRVRDESCPSSSPAFAATTAQLTAITAKGSKAPAKSTPAKAAAKKAPAVKAPRKNPEANDAFQAAMAAGLGLKAAHRAFRTVMQAQAVSA